MNVTEPRGLAFQMTRKDTVKPPKLSARGKGRVIAWLQSKNDTRRHRGQGLAVSLACDKAKDHGYPHELWTTLANFFPNTPFVTNCTSLNGLNPATSLP